MKIEIKIIKVKIDTTLCVLSKHSIYSEILKHKPENQMIML